MSENTIRRRCGIAKQFFRKAVRAGALKENPFRELKGQTRGNTARQFFVSYETFENVIAHCPNAEWRLIVALGRLGGLRIPSELFALKWSDVNLPDGRMILRSSKTEHHENGGIRICPIFPELKPFFLDVDALAQPGEVYVINRDRIRTTIRKGFRTIIEKAGIKPWPKLWANCRSSRVTELLNHVPLKAVCEWMGHKQAVALEHYAQVTSAHFEAAVSKPTTQGEAKTEAIAKRIPKPNGAEPNVTKYQETTKAQEIQGFSADHNTPLRSIRVDVLGDAGLERFDGSDSPALSYDQTPIGGEAKGEAFSPNLGNANAQLARVVAAWPNLDQVTKRAILSILPHVEGDEICAKAAN